MTSQTPPVLPKQLESYVSTQAKHYAEKSYFEEQDLAQAYLDFKSGFTACYSHLLKLAPEFEVDACNKAFQEEFDRATGSFAGPPEMSILDWTLGARWQHSKLQAALSAQTNRINELEQILKICTVEDDSIERLEQIDKSTLVIILRHISAVAKDALGGGGES